jgi:hypothetical protein
MSSYANYCHDQATDCARRARLASSPEIIAYCRTLELRWLKLAGWAQKAGGTLGHDSSLVATYPVEYGKRAGELIARGARSLTPRKPKQASDPPVITRRDASRMQLSFLSNCDDVAAPL